MPGREAADERQDCQGDESCKDLPIGDQNLAKFRASMRHDDDGMAFEAHEKSLVMRGLIWRAARLVRAEAYSVG